MDDKVVISDATPRHSEQAPGVGSDGGSVGFDGSSIVMGKHSDRASFKHTLDTRGIDLNPMAFEGAFARMKRTADQTGEVSEFQMQAIVDEVVSGTEILQGVAESFR